MNDREILALYQRRQEAAIAATAEKYGGLCRRISENLLGPEDAEECVNDVLHAAWTRIPPEAPNSLGAWLGRVTRNLSISRFRKNRAQKRHTGMDVLLSELNDCLPDPVDVAEAVEAAELSEILSSWLDCLPREDRSAFIRRYWYGDAVQKLAEEIGCTPAQMSQRLLRLRKKLKKHLEAKGVCL